MVWIPAKLNEGGAVRAVEAKRGRKVRVRLITTQAGSSSKAVDRLEKQLRFQKKC
ncbi:hypothetical protein F2Q68_00046385 [Brassica cretica]|uniref:Uncharacterized protein n=1 Tax=Brassica cretica TaxID=69181 RepID=A0A8S9LKV3_BRACR|nr:hypothetical protein F2Q68_00046385 [Brassica cretica]